MKVAVIIGACTLIAIAGPRTAEAQPLAAPQAELVKQHCVTCHNTRTRAGDLTLDTVVGADVRQHTETWERVLRKVRVGAMPPPGLPRPEASVERAFTTALSAALDRAASEHPKPGKPSLQRLNRTEYANAIRDLLALDVDATALLPPDDPAAGFDNNADLLGVSPGLLERYLSAAAKLSALAVGSPSLGAGTETYRVRGDASQTGHVEGLPLGTRGGLLAHHTFPLDAEYVIKVKLLETNMGAIRGLEEPHQVEITLDGSRVFLAGIGGEEDFRVSANNATDMVNVLDARLTVRVAVKAGAHDVGASFLQRTSAQGGTKLQAFERSTIDAMYHSGLPHVASVTIAGPFNAAGPGDTPSRRRVFVCRPARPDEETACAATIIKGLARRAYRRPPTPDELARLQTLYRDGYRQQGFERGIEFALRGVLANPKFIFRGEAEPPDVAPGTIYPISDLELASRLSFFLWSSVPDDQLLDLAVAGRLSRPAVLEQQVRRMLADRRGDALVTSFASQWLQLRNVRSAAPDKNLFPDFDDNLRQALIRETELFVDSIIREDRSALDLITADYTFLNERLATHYGVLGVKGSQFRRVRQTNPARYGLLGQGSILLLTSHSDRTSPVVRGKWVLENLLGMSPPPPPPNVPPLPDEEGTVTLPMRARMESHRRAPACANCHKIMDPIGLALENFDAVGVWRTKEAGAAVDASGQLMDGTRITGVESLREAVVSRPDVFVGTVAEKLLTYAIGRRLESDDMPPVRAIVRDAQKQNYRVSALIMGVATSAPLRLRQVPARAAGEASP
jgi:hypothetical protein